MHCGSATCSSEDECSVSATTAVARVKKDCVIIDVGINRVDNGNKKIVGDVDFENIKDKVKAITPVPGGVGPMTISCLLNNTLKAYKKINSI